MSALPESGPSNHWDGPDLGALHFKLIEAVKPLLVVGEGVSPYGAGHAWHHFEQRLGFAPMMVEIHRLSRIQLSNYTHLVMTDGNYSAIGTKLKKAISDWVLAGGILITAQKASTWAESICFSGKPEGCKNEIESDDDEAITDRPYASYQNDRAQKIIGGAIVSTSIDLTHPITFGYQRPNLPVFRRGTTLLKASDNPYSTPVPYSETLLLAGFIGEQRKADMSGQPAVIAERKGASLVVRFANNPLFRGFWRGTERLFNNALYMGQVITTTELPE